MIVVSDTSPLRGLSHLDSLDVLETLFGEILIPPAVERELLTPPARLARVDVSQWPFLRVTPPRNQQHVRKLSAHLDPGESEALALALETQADAVLIDEAAGRASAAQLGLTVIGTLGILLRAKQKQLLGPLAPHLDSLQNELGFFVSPALRAEVLEKAGE